MQPLIYFARREFAMSRFVRGFAFTLVLGMAGLAWSSLAADEPKAPAKPAESHDVDIVLCLDVSGSMEGLIASAKTKLWDIVNELAKAKPSPSLRVALYSYGHATYDPKKGWVRKELDLSTDLDELYKKLFALTINGGEEYVARVCRDAIVEQPWSKGKNALKLIFVCGNEPASQDPTLKLKAVADLAKQNDIIINPIYCGNSDDPDARDWRELSGLAGGRFTTINHNKQVAIATPVDKDLAKLANELNGTYIAYGKEKGKAKNQAEQTDNASKAGQAVLAARVTSQAGGLYQCDDWCLVDKCKKDAKFDITKLKDDELPEVMKKMTAQERVAYVKDMTQKRDNLNKQIMDLSKQREVFIRNEMKRNPNQADRAFQTAINETLRIQAGAKGLKIPE